MSRPFLDRSNDRRLPPDYRGDVLLWDIDKTYLDTHFSSLRGLAAIPFEWAHDKAPVPGAIPLLRGLRRGAGPTPAATPLYFVSGSPPSLRGVIERRMLLDGVDFDGVTFKDQLGLLRALRPADLKRQVGYKLLALLLYRAELPPGARWLLFGDDVEQDYEVFLLFGEVCAGLRGGALDSRLRAHKVHAHDRALCLEAASALAPAEDPVEAVFIHQVRGRPSAELSDPRCVASPTYLSAALSLWHQGKLPGDSLAAVADAVLAAGVPRQTVDDELEATCGRLGLSLPDELLGS